jgi:hypothetical protein
MPRKWLIAWLAGGALIICLQLLVPPILGVADNCDFDKLSGHACIGPADKDHYPYFNYYAPKYVIQRKYCGSIIPTSAVVPLFISIAPARWFLPAGEYDLRFLGLLYAVIFLGVFAMFLTKADPSPPVAAFVMLVFFSAVYVPLFSTFYMDTAAFVFLLWTIMLAVRILTEPKPGIASFAALVVAVLLVATTKLQHATVAACFLPVFWLRLGRTFFPSVWVRLAATIMVFVGIGIYLHSASPWYRAIALYDGLFFKFLPATDHPTDELRKFGLDASFDQYIGKHAYSEGNHMQEQSFALAFGRKVTVPKMTAFLIVHPKVVIRALWHDLEEASLERVRMKIGDREYRLGNYEANSGHTPESQSSFLTPWSTLKLAVYARRPLVYLGYCLVLVGLLWAAAWRQVSGRAEALIGAGILTAILPATFAPAFLDAVDTGRHLFLFNVVLDIGACSFVWLAVRLCFGQSRSQE